MFSDDCLTLVRKDRKDDCHDRDKDKDNGQKIFPHGTSRSVLPTLHNFLRGCAGKGITSHNLTGISNDNISQNAQNQTNLTSENNSYCTICNLKFIIVSLMVYPTISFLDATVCQ